MSYVSDQQDEPLAPGVVEAVRRHAWIVVVSAAVGFLAALTVTVLVLPERFVAHASLTLDDPQQGIFNSRAAPPEEFERYINGVADFVGSAEVLDEAVMILDDDTDRRELDDFISATADPPARAIRVAAQAGTASGSVARVSAVVDAFEELHEERLEDSAERAVAALEDQIAEADIAVADAGAALSAAPDNLALQAQLNAVVDRMAALRGRVDEITVNARAFGAGIEFVDDPERPSEPSSPNRMTLGAAGLLGGFLAGMVLAWLYADKHRSVWTSDEPELLIGTPLLGKVPALRRNEPTLSDPAAMPAEPYQFVTSTLLAALPGARGVALVTSADGGAGKSVTVANVAVAAALDARDVLVVDASPDEALARLFGVEARQDGLLEALASDNLAGRLRTVDIDGGSLQFLSYGTTSRLTAVNRLRSEKAGRLFADLRRRFDLILVDCPALLRSATAAALASWSDGLVLVVRRGTDGGDITDANHRVAGTGVPLLGYVFTQAAWRERLRRPARLGADLPPFPFGRQVLPAALRPATPAPQEDAVDDDEARNASSATRAEESRSAHPPPHDKPRPEVPLFSSLSHPTEVPDDTQPRKPVVSPDQAASSVAAGPPQDDANESGPGQRPDR